MLNDIFYIPVLNNYLLHAPLYGITALVNKTAVNNLKHRAILFAGDPLFDLQKLLSKHPTIPSAKKGPVDALFLGLVTTRNCNLSCAYCGFGASTAPKATLDLDMAMAAVDWIVENTLAHGKKVMNIHFFGGEPFISWDLVEAVVHKARWEATKHGLTPYFEASTNGVLSESRARFVGDYFDVVVLSLDGFKEFHDRNRAKEKDKGSFDQVCSTARLWSEMPVKLCLRTCVTQESVHSLEDIGRWYCETFKPEVVNFDTLQTWPSTINAELYAPDPYEFASHFVGARNIIESYGIEVVYAADFTSQPKQSFCPVGKDAIILTPGGRINGCYLLEEDWQKRGLDFNLGKINSKLELEIDLDSVTEMRSHVASKPSCANCFCKWSCAGGCHVNHSYPNALLDESFCAQTKIITVCSLLNELDERKVQEALLNDHVAMETLSNQDAYHEPISL